MKDGFSGLIGWKLNISRYFSVSSLVLCCFLHIIRSMPCLLAAVCYSCGGTVESAVFCFVLFFTLMVAVYADQISLSR